MQESPQFDLDGLLEILLNRRSTGGSAGFQDFASAISLICRSFLLGCGLSDQAAADRTPRMVMNITVAAEGASQPYSSWLEGELLAGMREEFHQASHMQERLLGAGSASTPGLDVASVVRSCERVGGDLVRVYTRDGQTLLAAGDGSGHGTGAALAAALAVGALEVTLRQTLSPLPILVSLDMILRELHLAPAYLALMLALWEPAKCSITFSNNGHPYAPMVVRDHSPFSVLASGTWLGFPIRRQGPAFQTVECSVHAGDVILLFSDGIPDQEGKTGEQYGTERLAKKVAELSVLPASDIAARLIRDVDGFAYPCARCDDQSVIVAKVL